VPVKLQARPHPRSLIHPSPCSPTCQILAGDSCSSHAAVATAAGMVPEPLRPMPGSGQGRLLAPLTAPDAFAAVVAFAALATAPAAATARGALPSTSLRLRGIICGSETLLWAG